MDGMAEEEGRSLSSQQASAEGTEAEDEDVDEVGTDNHKGNMEKDIERGEQVKESKTASILQHLRATEAQERVEGSNPTADIVHSAMLADDKNDNEESAVKTTFFRKFSLLRKANEKSNISNSAHITEAIQTNATVQNAIQNSTNGLSDEVAVGKEERHADERKQKSRRLSDMLRHQKSLLGKPHKDRDVSTHSSVNDLGPVEVEVKGGSDNDTAHENRRSRDDNPGQIEGTDPTPIPKKRVRPPPIVTQKIQTRALTPSVVKRKERSKRQRQSVNNPDISTRDEEEDGAARKLSERKVMDEKSGEQAGLVNDEVDGRSQTEGMQSNESASKAKVAHRKKQRKVPKEKQGTGQPTGELFTSIGKRPDDFAEDILTLQIHRAEGLKVSEGRMGNGSGWGQGRPVVRVWILDQHNGIPLVKSDPLRPVTSFSEGSKIDYILPVITKPFNLRENHSNTPQWEDSLVYNEDYLHIVQEHVIFFFEILDFPDMRNKSSVHNSWSRVAWAFLKPVGLHGQANTERLARLQLYEYAPNIVSSHWKPHRVKGQRGEPTGAKAVPEVFYIWKGARWRKHDGFLLVSALASPQPEMKKVNSRALVPTDVETGRVPFADLVSPAFRVKPGENAPTADIGKKHQWRRAAGQRCKVPNHCVYRLDAGTRGCLTLAFSQDGHYLAAGCFQKNSYPIKLFSTTTGERLLSLIGHQDLVYEIGWAEGDRYLVSASSDCSARLWEIGDNMSSCVAVCQHPSFAYSAQVHPVARNPRLIATGCFDTRVRLFSDEGVVVSVLTGHRSYVNAVCFDPSGELLYSADGQGVIKVWSGRSGGSGTLRDWDTMECTKTVVVGEFKDSPISGLRLHPNLRKLLVNARDGTAITLDLRLFRVLTAYSPLAVTQESSIEEASDVFRWTNATYTPCGSFVYAGNRDGTVNVYEVDTGNLVATYDQLGFTNPVSCVAYHPFDHLVAFSSFGMNEDCHPVLLFTYDKVKKPVTKAIFKSAEDGVNFSTTTTRKEGLDNAAKISEIMGMMSSMASLAADRSYRSPKMDKADNRTISAIRPVYTAFDEEGVQERRAERRWRWSQVRLNTTFDGQEPNDGNSSLGKELLESTEKLNHVLSLNAKGRSNAKINYEPSVRIVSSPRTIDCNQASPVKEQVGEVRNNYVSPGKASARNETNVRRSSIECIDVGRRTEHTEHTDDYGLGANTDAIAEKKNVPSEHTGESGKYNSSGDEGQTAPKSRKSNSKIKKLAKSKKGRPVSVVKGRGDVEEALSQEKTEDFMSSIREELGRRRKDIASPSVDSEPAKSPFGGQSFSSPSIHSPLTSPIHPRVPPTPPPPPPNGKGFRT